MDLINSLRRVFSGASPAIPAPDLEASDVAEEYHRKWDKKDNEALTPPSDEAIRLHSVWLAEAYPASYRDRLLECLSTLQWSNPVFGDISPPVADWIARARSFPGIYGWYNLGSLVSPNHSHGPFLMNRKQMALPPGVTVALPCIHQTLPSVTLLSVQFILAEDQSQSYETILREFTPGERQPHASGGLSYFPVQSAKQKLINRERNRLLASFAEWIRRTIPGIYSAGLLGGSFPSWELITSRNVRPFPDERPALDYLAPLGINGSWHAWQEARHPSIRLGSRLGDRDEWSMVLGAREEDLLHDFDISNALTVPYTLEFMSQPFSRWSLLCLLQGYENLLAQIRDSTRADPEELRLLTQNLLLMRNDIETFCASLAPLTDSSRFARTAEHDFLLVSSNDTDETGTFLIRVRDTLAERGASLNTLLLTSIESVSALTNLASATALEDATRSGVKMQRITLFLTILVVVLTIEAVFPGSIRQLVSSLANLFQRL